MCMKKNQFRVKWKLKCLNKACMSVLIICIVHSPIRQNCMPDIRSSYVLQGKKVYFKGMTVIDVASECSRVASNFVCGIQSTNKKVSSPQKSAAPPGAVAQACTHDPPVATRPRYPHSWLCWRRNCAVKCHGYHYSDDLWCSDPPFPWWRNC